MPKLTKRADGRYQINVYLGVGENGKKQYKTVYGKTQKEALSKADELRVKLGKGLDISAQRDTFRVWVKLWLAGKTCGKGQLTSYESCIAHFEELNDWEIGKIRTSDLQTILNDLSETLSQKTLDQCRMALRQVFKTAIVNRVLEYNPADALVIPKKAAPPQERKPLTDEQISWVRETPHRAQLPAMIMLYCGLRRGEVMALRWSDIDLENNVLRIRRTIEMIKGQPVEKDGGKSGAAVRDVPIPDALYNFFVEYKPMHPSAKDKSVELFPLITSRARSGSHHTASSWEEMWSSYMKALNLAHGDFSFLKNKPTSIYDRRGVPFVIEEFTAHQLRHTYATLLYEAGVDVITAQHLLGHAKVETTLEIYTHLREKHRTSEIAKLNDYLKTEISQIIVK